MHPRRKEMLFGFAVTCVTVAFFAYATIRKPGLFFGGFLAGFSVAATLLAYRVFWFSDTWYRVREHASEAWFARHPRTATLLTVLAISGFVLQVFVLFIWPHVH